MAVLAPLSKDTTELQFILASKNRIFSDEIPVADQKCDLLATASTHGIVIVGCTTPELRVCMLKDLTSQINTEENKTIPLKVIPLPSQPFQLSINCDQSLLAVDINVNGIPHIQIYYVPSFLTNNIQKLTEFRVSQMNSRTSQILWNPVLSNMLSVCTENGGLSVYTLKPQGFEMHSLEGNERAHCACWSPKGKQIVVGFANGKLIQFKPDLKPARVIDCPPNTIEGGPFNIIALQWLSTYQFAAVFLSTTPDATPALHIVNAPKAGPPTYINYDDICYSQSGPRQGQVFLLHIIQWNLLLVASANSVEVGVLGTTESGEAPTWIQSTLAEFRAELPLYKNKEIFPIGFVLETGISEGIIVDEAKQKVMPMIHILATNGTLVSFNFMNYSPGYVDICSPPKPIDNAVVSQFQSIELTKKPQSAPESGFSFGAAVTSTPAPTTTVKPKPLFGDPAPSTGLFGNAPKPTGFGMPTSSTPTQPLGISFGTPAAQPFNVNPIKNDPPKPVGISFGTSLPAAEPKPVAPPPAQPEKPKPLITVNPTFTPAASQPQKTSDVSSTVAKDKQEPSKVDADENKKIFNRMIKEELFSFEKELRELLASSKSRVKCDVGTEDESKKLIQTTDELMELKKEATETVDSLRFEIQTLKLELNEIFAMQFEAKSKCQAYKSEKNQFIQDNQVTDKTSRRQLDKLMKLLSQNEMQLNSIIQLMDCRWSAYLETISTNKKNKMRVPNLEGLYQALSKQQEIIYSEREKIAMFKRKLGIRDEIKKQKSHQDMNNTFESLTDSLISLSMADQVKAETDKLTNDKLSTIKRLLKNRQTVVIKPSRPERSDINSTVVLEKRYQAMKQRVKAESVQQRTIAPAKPKSQAQEKVVAPKTTAPVKPVEPPAQPSFFQQPVIPKPNIKEPPIAVSATFSIPIPSKPAENPVKVLQPVIENKKPEEKPSKNENVSFTFKLPDKKETSKPASAAPAFAPLISDTKSDNKQTEAPKPNFSFSAAAFGGGDGKIGFGASTGGSLFGAPSTISFGGSTEVTPLSFGMSSGGGSLSFGDSNKTSPFAALTTAPVIATPAATPIVSITPIDTSKKTVEPVIPTPVFKISASTDSGPVVSTSTPPVTSAPAKPKDSVFTGFGDLNKQLNATKVNPTMAATTVVTSAPAETTVSTNKPPEPKPFDLSQTVKPTPSAPLAFGVTITPISSTPAATTTAAASNVTAASSFSFGNMALSVPQTTATASTTSVTTTTSTITSSAPTSSVFATPATTPTVSPTFGEFLAPKSEEKKEPSDATISTGPPATATTTSSVFSAAQPFATSTASVDFGGFNICSPTTTKPQTLASSTSSPFGVAKSEAGSLFGTAQPFGNPATAPQSIFGTATSTPSLFGAAPARSDQSIFGAPPTSPFSGFGAGSGTTASPFGQTAQPAAGGSIFGGGTTGGSIFGSTMAATVTTASTPSFGSPFGATAQQATSGGSLFGGASAFGSGAQSGGSIFGGGSTSTFGATAGGSIFGGGSQPAANTGGIFGGGTAFGGQVTGSSLAGGFAKPAFGASPTFGGAPTFGSPNKTGFGLFTQTQPQPQPTGSPQQGNQLFEQLGASNTGISFGNLAQTSPVQNPNNANTGFAGSSFSSWR